MINMAAETFPTVIDTRLVNALIFNPEPSQQAIEGANRVSADGGRIAFPRAGPRKGLLSRVLSKIIKGELARRRNRRGGLWVGGKTILTKTELNFAPNALNAAFHAIPERLGWTVPLALITAIRVRRGVLTNIIEVQTVSGQQSIRCFGAGSFAANIEKASLSIRASTTEDWTRG